MLFRETVAVYCANHMEHTVTPAVARQRPANKREIMFPARYARQQLDTIIMGSANRHERNNGTQQMNGAFYLVRVEVLYAGQAWSLVRCETVAAQQERESGS
jgi:hypothetical protein